MLVEFYNQYWPYFGFLSGFSFIFMLNSGKKDDKSIYEFWAVLFVSGLLMLGIWFVLLVMNKHPDNFAIVKFVFFFIVGGGGGFLLLRKAPVITEQIHQNYTKTTAAERNKKTDVREISKHYPVIKNGFEPEQYFRSDKQVFIGLDESDRPIVISDEVMPHIQIAGTTGYGKGVIMAVMGAQWIRNGEAVFCIDPKDDEWGPHSFAEAAKNANKKHYFINAREKVPQFAIFKGADADEIEELFIAGFGLNDTGSASDFYSIDDRKYAGIIARQIYAEQITPAQAYSQNSEVLEKNAPKFSGKLRELGEVTAANADPQCSFDFKEIIENGGSCYIIGHMRIEKIIRLQKMLLVRLMQIAEKRDRINKKLRPVGIILDEAKYHLSKCALEALGAARDKGIHLVIAHQSLSDLQDVGRDLNGDSVVGAVVENCKIKICYRVMNPLTAEWLARMSGSILVDDEVRTVEKNIALSEKMASERSIRQAERYFIDENMMLNLPKTVAVVYGLGLAKFAHITNMTVEKNAGNVKISSV